MLLAQDDGVDADDFLGPKQRVSSLWSHQLMRAKGIFQQGAEPFFAAISVS